MVLPSHSHFNIVEIITRYLNPPFSSVISLFAFQLANLEGNLQNVKDHLTKTEGSRKEINDQVSSLLFDVLEGQFVSSHKKQ